MHGVSLRNQVRAPVLRSPPILPQSRAARCRQSAARLRAGGRAEQRFRKRFSCVHGMRLVRRTYACVRHCDQAYCSRPWLPPPRLFVPPPLLSAAPYLAHTALISFSTAAAPTHMPLPLALDRLDRRSLHMLALTCTAPPDPVAWFSTKRLASIRRDALPTSCTAPPSTAALRLKVLFSS